MIIHMRSITVLILSGIFTGNNATTFDLNNQGLSDITLIPPIAECSHYKAQYNHFTLIPAEFFVNFPSLATIWIDHNQISHVEDLALSGIGASLTSIDISHNSLVKIQRDAFSGLTSLQQLGKG